MNDHYSLLGVSRQSSTAEIANAYRQLLIRERQEKGDQAEFGAYSLAYRTLTNHGRRLDYDRFLDELSGKYLVKDPEAPTEAEKCYLAGLTCMEQKNFQDAVDYLYRAVQLEPEVSHFCSQLGLALGMFKDRLAEAERYCKKAISIDPDNPDFRFNLGFLYQRHNLVDAAQTAFDLANEAIRARQARLLKENEPLITPWEEGQDLLDELSRLESIVDGIGEIETAKAAAPEKRAGMFGGTEAAPPAASPGAPEELVSESDLLRQLDDLESQVSKTELAEALAATAEQAEAPMEPFLDDDLLKELDLLAAQVRGVEEYHNGELARAALEVAKEPAAGPSDPAASEVDRFKEFFSQESIQVPVSVGEETLHEMSLNEPPQPQQEPEPVQSPVELAEPETAAEATEPVPAETATDAPGEPIPAAVPESEVPTEPVAAQAGPWPAVSTGGKTDEPVAPPSVSEGTASEETAGPEDRRLPRGPAVEKIRMLDELESELLGELELIRREREKLQSAV